MIHAHSTYRCCKTALSWVERSDQGLPHPHCPHRLRCFFSNSFRQLSHGHRGMLRDGSLRGGGQSGISAIRSVDVHLSSSGTAINRLSAKKIEAFTNHLSLPFPFLSFVLHSLSHLSLPFLHPHSSLSNKFPTKVFSPSALVDGRP